MEQAHTPSGLRPSPTSGTVTFSEVTRVPVDRSRIEDRIAKALERAEAFFPVFATQDSSAETGSVVDSGGETTQVTTSPTAASKDAAVGVPQASEGDRVSSGNRREPMDNSDDALFVAKQQRALRAKDSEVSHLRRTVRELSTNLHQALTVLDQRTDTSVELQALKKACEAEAAANEKHLRDVRLEMLESRVGYRAKEEQLATTYAADVCAKAAELLDPHTKEVHEKNFELLKEKIMLAQELARVRSNYGELHDKYTRLKRITDLSGDASRQMFERSIHQKDEIAALRLQVKTTEENLSAAVDKYEKRHVDEVKAHRDALQFLTRERDEARRDALKLHRELEQLRRAAGNLVTQRSELETFFHAALNEVRQNVIAERRRMLIEAIPAGRSVNSRQVLPTHTTSSILRLENSDRPMLTNSDALPLPPASSPTGWTVDRKGFPKRIAAGPWKGRNPISGAAASGRSARGSTPNDDSTPQKTQLLPPTDIAKGNSGILTIHHVTPPYLRFQEHDAPALPTPGGDRSVNVGTPVDQEDASSAHVETSAPFRLGAAPEIPGCGPPLTTPPDGYQLIDAAAANRTQLSRVLPTNLTWRNVKSVDVSELCWADKERVIQLLLKRIRQEGQRPRKLPQLANGKDDASERKLDAVAPAKESASTPEDMGNDLLTFLTQ